MALVSFFKLIFFTITFSSSRVVLGYDMYSGGAILCMGNSTGGSTYKSNVDLILSELASESSRAHPPFIGFFNGSAGIAPDKAYGSYLCRGDLSIHLCHGCVSEVTRVLSQNKIYTDCFGFGGFTDQPLDHCLVHYANYSRGYMNGSVMSFGKIGGKASNYQQYNETLTATIEGLVKEAALGNWSNPYFETRVVQVARSKERIYTLVQCTSDISMVNCSKCLGELYSFLPECCNGTQGALVIHANCLLKYNNQSFFGNSCRGFVLISYLHC
ncbi:hypothetical protein Cgig2_028338 [Carnegiea gigantea]|uniref:Gnk2-homologous domain-containing protein n=1 Tax=Carnegiea gigantea TaxID=171969 RepID=A0A9Q1QJ39_9CARY|nr:hypothetical protein Cgig2_028338 [Carnegiea gigantea]